MKSQLSALTSGDGSAEANAKPQNLAVMSLNRTGTESTASSNSMILLNQQFEKMNSITNNKSTNFSTPGGPDNEKPLKEFNSSQ